MVKKRFSKHFARALGLIALGCVLFSVAPANRVTTLPLPVMSPAASPTPVPTPEVKRPNPVQRFFSSVIHGITGVFRRPNRFYCRLPPIVDLTSSSSLITVCPVAKRSFSGSCSTGEVTLTANASAPEELLFTWSVPAGRLRGEGFKVIWDLSNVPEGNYTATVEVNDGNQLTASSATTVTVASCTDCRFLESPCPIVSVSCPDGVDPKQSITFEATVSPGRDLSIKPTYEWSLSAGKIISGQGTSKVVVDVSDLAGQSLTGTVSLGGIHPLCAKVASCTARINQ